MIKNRAAVPHEVPTTNSALLAWVESMAKLTKPDDVVWCDGSAEEKDRLTRQAVEAGVLMPLNQEKLPGCYLHRSNPNDVARTEHLTFICTRTKEAAGPNNNWMDPKDAYAKLGALFDGAMRGPDDVRRALRHGPDRLAASRKSASSSPTASTSRSTCGS